jgi:hypothetical protein
MALTPSQQAGAFQSGPSSFTASSNNFGTESKVHNFRPATNVRNIMHWLIPQGPVVQMYINPQNISYNYKKGITPTRTKGGYTIQYWGEELTVLNISGTTGTSGIEGINVLEDLYRNEQVQFDPYALYLQSQINQSNQSPSLSTLFGSPSPSASPGSSPGASIAGALLGAAQQIAAPSSQQPPTLASLAMTVEMYWSGEVYRGFFTSFTVRESVDHLGMFFYDLSFSVTQKRGFRSNFLPWHRSPNNGPSNSDPQFGTPYSFGTLTNGNQTSNIPQQSSSAIDPFDIF